MTLSSSSGLDLRALINVLVVRILLGMWDCESSQELPASGSFNLCRRNQSAENSLLVVKKSKLVHCTVGVDQDWRWTNRNGFALDAAYASRPGGARTNRTRAAGVGIARADPLSWLTWSAPAAASARTQPPGTRRNSTPTPLKGDCGGWSLLRVGHRVRKRGLPWVVAPANLSSGVGTRSLTAGGHLVGERAAEGSRRGSPETE
jgi:hypothetical protein